MLLKEWLNKIEQLRASNGWIIEVTFRGIFIIKVFDKETTKLLASTGSTGLECLPDILQIPFNKCPWTDKE